jgi:4-hydroxymandelate oxidase
MAEPLDLYDYERLAPGRMSEMAWEFISSGAADELTCRWNREAYQRIRLLPRHLVDVSKLDTRVRLFGVEMPHPVLMAPVAYQKLVHSDGELGTVKGAGAEGATMVLSSFSTISLEDVAAAATAPLWFQLYIQPDRGFTLDLVRRVEAAGYRALVVTVDTPVLGARYREHRVNFALPPGLVQANLAGLASATGRHHLPAGREIYSAVLDPALTWKDIDWLRAQTSLPIILKGIMNPDDAVKSAESGVAGLIVSNHGGRNLDTVPATIDALPAIVAKVGGRMPVLVDGGIRRGTDILKALAFGASAVLIGRPYVYGLSVGGAGGVAHVIQILRRELERAMALSGLPTISSINGSAIFRQVRSD